MAHVRLFGSIEKFDKQDDGSVVISGVASTESLDAQGEIVSADAMRKALPAYMLWGNIREQHTSTAVGKALSAEVDADGKTRLTARVVDSEAVKKVIAGVYKGFSIAGQTLSKMDKVITRLTLGEISICDRPANPECVFSIWKAETNTPKPMIEQEFLAKALGLPEKATKEEVLTAFTKAITHPAPAVAAAAVVPAPQPIDFQKALDAALKTVTDKLTAMETKAAADAQTFAKAEKAVLVAEASREGKVIPLTPEEIDQVPTPVLKAMIGKLSKTVPVAARSIKPLKTDERETIRKNLGEARQRGSEQMTEFFKSQPSFQNSIN
jgi:hypothetical protein